MENNELRNLVRRVINEASEFDESFKFDWKNNKYKWVDDKDDKNIDTAMVRKDEEGKPAYNFKKQLLPKSDIMSYNLFKIKNFNVTQSLKHGKVKKNKQTREMIPDESITDFKTYTAKYIARLMTNLGYSIDVILTPNHQLNLIVRCPI